MAESILDKNLSLRDIRKFVSVLTLLGTGGMGVWGSINIFDRFKTLEEKNEQLFKELRELDKKVTILETKEGIYRHGL